MASGDGLLFKIAVTFGLFMALIGLIYPWANAAWNNVGVVMQSFPTFPTFPSFNNPNANPYNHTVPFVADGPTSPDATDCTEWYQCLNTESIATSVTFDGNFSVVLGAINVAAGSVFGIKYSTWCKNNVGVTTGLTFNFTLSDGTLFYALTRTPLCGPSIPYTYVFLDSVANISVAKFNFATLNVDTYGSVGHDHDSTTLYYLELVFFFQTSSPASTCASLDFGCAFIGAASVALAPIITLINWIIYTVQVIIDVLGFIGNMLLWVGNIIVNVLIAMAVSMSYLFALPGCPQPIQWLVDALAIGFALVFSLAILDRMIGIFGGFVNKT